MSLFRRATPQDLVFMGQLVREFWQKQGQVYGIAYDHESCLATIAKTLVEGVALVGPASCAGALFGPFPYNYRVVVAYVPFWYFRRPREMKILPALIDECRGMGAHRINVTSHPPGHRIGRFYARLGMRAVEGQWFGKLD